MLSNTSYTATITLDPANAINETSEDNNILGNITFVYLPAEPVTPSVPPGFVPVEIFLIVVGVLAGAIVALGILLGVMVTKVKKQGRDTRFPTPVASKP
nr:hypothetical protein [Candidatus Sigynarchaeota archaeon]